MAFGTFHRRTAAIVPDLAIRDHHGKLVARFYEDAIGWTVPGRSGGGSPMTGEPPRPRHRPPQRRLSETRRVLHVRSDGAATPILVSIGYDAADPLRPVEVFYAEGFRSGADPEFLTQDACVLVSLLLQHGLPPARIAASLSLREDPDGRLLPGSLAGTIAAELACPPAWADAVDDEPDA